MAPSIGKFHVEPFSAAFGFLGRQADLLASEDEDEDNLAAELNDCLENAHSICFLALYLDASAIDSARPTHGLFFFRGDRGARIFNVRRATKDVLCVRHDFFRNGLPTIAGKLVAAGTSASSTATKPEYSFLCAELQQAGDAPHDAGQDAAGEPRAKLKLSREKMAGALFGSGSQVQKDHDEAVLREGWAAWQSVIASQNFTDQHGRPLRSLYSLPTCVTAESIAGAVMSPPMANIVLGLSTPLSDRNSFRLLCDLHHWLCYRQFSSLLLSNTARIYNQVVEHINHEIGKSTKVIKNLLSEPGASLEDLNKLLDDLAAADDIWKSTESQTTNWRSVMLKTTQTALPSAHVRLASMATEWQAKLLAFIKDPTRASVTLTFSPQNLQFQAPVLTDRGLATLRRAIYAAVRNALEWTLRAGRSPDEVALTMSICDGRCIFRIKNPCRASSDDAQARENCSDKNTLKVGTREVIAFCLMRLGGRVDLFSEFKDDSGASNWVTEFSMPWQD